jgi:putative ABC transport system permease protein
MNWFSRLLRRVRALRRQEQFSREMEEEMSFHLELEIEDLVSRGYDREAARRRALLTFGGLDRYQEEGREARGTLWFDQLWRDFRYAVRSLARTPAFTAVALLTLALGIGANTAMFSVVRGILLRPLPYHEPHRLAMLWTQDLKRDIREEGTSYATVADWRSQTRLFEDLAVVSRGRELFLTGGNEPMQTMGESVSANLFPLLGVAPAIGRGFTASDESIRDARDPRHEFARSAAQMPVIISHNLWVRRFGSDPSVEGQLLEVNGERLRVVGVMPRGFYFPTKQTELWWPIDVNPSDRYNDEFRVVGRLRPGATFTQAQREMTAIGRRLTAWYPQPEAGFVGFDVNVVPMLTQFTGRNLPIALWVLLGAVGFVLLIACANVANLLLARGAARQREFAVRKALGAGRLRLIRQLLTESGALALTAGVVGFGFATITIRALVRLAPSDLPRLDEIGIDPIVLGFTLGVTVVTAFVFGVGPAISLSRAELNDWLREAARSSRGSLKLRQMRGALVVAECALAVALLAGAGLLIRSFLLLQRVDPGYEPRGALLMRVALPETASTSQADFELFYKQVIERLHAMPGVVSVGTAREFFFRRNPDLPIDVRGRSGAPVSAPVTSEDVSPEFLQTIGARLVRGRFFTERDQNRGVVIINQTLARRFLGDVDPIGQRLREHSSDGPWSTIIGVVADLHRQGLEKEPVAEFYQARASWLPTLDVAVRVRGDPIAMAGTVRREVRAIDSRSTILNISTVEQRLGELSAQRRFQTWLLTTFAALASLLSAIGIYGIMHYMVAERTHEIGIRVALGARAQDVLRIVLANGMRLAVIGLALGLTAALALTRVMTHLLFQVRPNDPITLLAVAGALLSVAFVACYVPAWRAARLDPLMALRHE